MTTDTHLPFSVNINLNAPSSPQAPKMTFPVVQYVSVDEGSDYSY